MNVLEQKRVEVDGETYTLQALPATVGLDIQFKLAKAEDGLSATLMKQMVCNSVLVGSGLMTDKDFDVKFSKNYQPLMGLVKEIMEFNFHEYDEEGNLVPLEQDATEENL